MDSNSPVDVSWPNPHASFDVVAIRRVRSGLRALAKLFSDLTVGFPAIAVVCTVPMSVERLIQPLRLCLSGESKMDA